MELAGEAEIRRVRERSPVSPWPVASTPAPAADLKPPVTSDVPGLTGVYDSELVDESSRASESAVESAVDRAAFHEVS